MSTTAETITAKSGVLIFSHQTYKSPVGQPLIQYLRRLGHRVAIRVSPEGAVRGALGV